MSEEYPILGLPGIRENPFQSRPLEGRNSDHLIGRSEIIDPWARFLRTRTARLTLLVGETGTGRTSLMRCISKETDLSLHLDMFHTDNHVQKILDEIYTRFVNFDTPSNNQELVHRLVTATEESSGSIPLITFDYPNADGEKLATIISNLLPALERLKAVVVVILSVNQRSQWPENLIEKFDHLEVVQPFTKEEVRQVCESRINNVANVAWNMPEGAVEYLYENTSGKASKIIRLMRDMVDYERENPREVKFEDEQEVVVREENSPVINIETDIDKSPDFDLDLDMLAEEPRNHPKPVRAEHFNPPPPSSFGGFGGLVSRNRTNMHVDPRFDENIMREPLDENSDGSDFWQSEDMKSVVISKEDEILEEPQIFEEEYEHEIMESPSAEPFEQIIEDPYEKAVLNVFGKILSNQNNESAATLSELLMRLRMPVIGQKESNALNIHVLRNLGKNESVIVEVSTQREFSPSDPRLQDQLGIKRPRMSQICNKLYRAGILSVQQKGKSRVFRVTNDAKVQLIAWGMMEAEA